VTKRILVLSFLVVVSGMSVFAAGLDQPLDFSKQITSPGALAAASSHQLVVAVPEGWNLGIAFVYFAFLLVTFSLLTRFGVLRPVRG